MKTYKVRHPVYVLYQGKKKVAYLHVVLGKLLPCQSINNYWVRSLSSGQDKNKDNSMRHFLSDTPESLSSWVSHNKATRVVKVIHEMEYKGYAE